MANILFWKLTEKYCFTIARVRIATRYKAQLAYSRKSCETILIIEHLKEVYHSICPALFRDGAFSCRHESPRALTGLAGCSGQSCRAPSRDLREIQVIISTFAHTGPRAEKAVCRRDAGKPTPRRRVGRLVCAAKTRARKAVRPPTYCRPSGQGLRGKSPCPPLRVALPGEPLAAGGTGGTNPRPHLCAGGAASVCWGLCF